MSRLAGANVNHLMGIAVCGLASCIGIFNVFRKTVSDNIKSSELSKRVVEVLKENKGAVGLLGEPIETLLAKYGGLGKTLTGQTDIEMDVKGPKSKGRLYFTIIEKDGKPNIQSVQLQIGSDYTKRLIIDMPST